MSKEDISTVLSILLLWLTFAPSSESKFSFASFGDLSMLTHENTGYSNTRRLGDSKALSFLAPSASIKYTFVGEYGKLNNGIGNDILFSSYSYSHRIRSSGCSSLAFTLLFQLDQRIGISETVCLKDNLKQCNSRWEVSRNSSEITSFVVQDTSCSVNRHVQIKVRREKGDLTSTVYLYVDDLVSPLLKVPTEFNLLNPLEEVLFSSTSSEPIEISSWTFSSSDQCDMGFVPLSNSCVANPILSLRECPLHSQCSECSQADFDCFWCSGLNQCIGGAAKQYCVSLMDDFGSCERKALFSSLRFSLSTIGVVVLGFVLVVLQIRRGACRSENSLWNIVVGGILGLGIAFVINCVLVQIDELPSVAASGLLVIFIIASNYFYQNTIFSVTILSSRGSFRIERIFTAYCLFSCFLCLQVMLGSHWKQKASIRLLIYFSISSCLSLITLYTVYTSRLYLHLYSNLGYKTFPYTKIQLWMVVSALLSGLYFALSFGNIEAEEQGKRNFFLEREYQNLYYPLGIVAGMFSTFFMPKEFDPSHKASHSTFEDSKRVTCAKSHVTIGRYLVHLKTMEFSNLGKHCAVLTCRQLDFLPFKCESCELVTCLDHRTPEAHSCTCIGKQAKTVLCPLCDRILPVKFGSTMSLDEIIENHITQGCEPLKSIKALKCNMKRCKTRSHPSTLVECKICWLKYCLKHRFPMDHDCKRRSTTNLVGISRLVPNVKG